MSNLNAGIQKMDAVFSELTKLHKLGLHSNVQKAASLLLNVAQNVPGSISKEEEIVTTLYCAEAYYKLGRYEKAVALYKNVLALKKSYGKSKLNISKSDEDISDNEKLDKTMDILSDSEIKHSIAECYIQLKRMDDARGILQSVPLKERNAQINMTLGKVFHEAGMNRSAIGCYREVLWECPLALEAAEGLFKLGVSGVDVNSLVSNATLCGIGWLNLWIKGHAHLYSYELKQAIETFKELLNQSSPVKKNIDLTTTLGQLYYYSGDAVSAKRILCQARELDRDNRNGLGLLATIYLSAKNTDELEKLVPDNWEKTNDKDAEMWTAISCLLYMHGKLSTAAVFANKACVADPQNVEAFVLKGCILYDMNKIQSAITNFREAFRLAPRRYEPHKGLVDCYLVENRTKDALAMAVDCCKVDNNSARSLTLHAVVLIKEKQYNKAKPMLKNALEKDKRYKPAAFLLAEILEQEGDDDGAVELLDKQRKITPCSKIHQVLAGVLQRTGEIDRAYNHYQAAIRLDPDNEKAKNGLASLESQSGTTLAQVLKSNSSDTVGMDEQSGNEPLAVSSEIADDDDYGLSSPEL